eukprot:Tbor_TRINITY_DN6063_c0_g2::TRINITY_DN6063_c0_g2_i1::g.11531::m.11531
MPRATMLTLVTENEDTPALLRYNVNGRPTATFINSSEEVTSLSFLSTKLPQAEVDRLLNIQQSPRESVSDDSNVQEGTQTLVSKWLRNMSCNVHLELLQQEEHSRLDPIYTAMPNTPLEPPSPMMSDMTSPLGSERTFTLSPTHHMREETVPHLRCLSYYRGKLTNRDTIRHSDCHLTADCHNVPLDCSLLSLSSQGLSHNNSVFSQSYLNISTKSRLEEENL